MFPGSEPGQLPTGRRLPPGPDWRRADPNADRRRSWARNAPGYGDARAERSSTARNSMPAPVREWDTSAERLEKPHYLDARRPPVRLESNATRANAVGCHPV